MQFKLLEQTISEKTGKKKTNAGNNETLKNRVTLNFSEQHYKHGHGAHLAVLLRAERVQTHYRMNTDLANGNKNNHLNLVTVVRV